MSQPQHTELLGLSLQQLTGLVEDLGQASYRARQLLDGLYRQRWSALEQFTTLPSAFRQQLGESAYAVGFPLIEKKFVSADGTIRYLLAFSDGHSVETVWMPEGDGGEAGDGSEDGDAELRELAFSTQHPALSRQRSTLSQNEPLPTTSCHPERADPAFGSASRRAPISEGSRAGSLQLRIDGIAPPSASPARWAAPSNAPSA